MPCLQPLDPRKLEGNIWTTECFQAAYKFLSGRLPSGGLQTHTKVAPIGALAPSTRPAEASTLGQWELLLPSSQCAEKAKINFNQCTHAGPVWTASSAYGLWVGTVTHHDPGLLS